MPSLSPFHSRRGDTSRTIFPNWRGLLSLTYAIYYNYFLNTATTGVLFLFFEYWSKESQLASHFRSNVY